MVVDTSWLAVIWQRAFTHPSPSVCFLPLPVTCGLHMQHSCTVQCARSLAASLELSWCRAVVWFLVTLQQHVMLQVQMYILDCLFQEDSCKQALVAMPCLVESVLPCFWQGMSHP